MNKNKQCYFINRLVMTRATIKVQIFRYFHMDANGPGSSLQALPLRFVFSRKRQVLILCYVRCTTMLIVPVTGPSINNLSVK